MATYNTPPVYPMVGSWWKVGTLPSSGPAFLTNLPTQLYCSPWQQMLNLTGVIANPFIWSTLIKVPPFVNVYARGDIIKPDNSVALYYYVAYKEYFYKGFTSCFEGLVVFQCNANGTIPRTY